MRAVGVLIMLVLIVYAVTDSSPSFWRVRGKSLWFLSRIHSSVDGLSELIEAKPCFSALDVLLCSWHQVIDVAGLDVDLNSVMRSGSVHNSPRRKSLSRSIALAVRLSCLSVNFIVMVCFVVPIVVVFGSSGLSQSCRAV